MKTSLLNLLFLLLLIGNISAQNKISFSQLTVEDGLSQNSVIAIAQDSIGYLWMATQDGLNKYDGKEFIYYDFIFDDITNSEFSDLGKLYLDQNQQLWAIPSSKIPQRYNYSNESFESPFDIEQVTDMVQDLQFNYWFATANRGLTKLNTQTGVIETIVDINMTDYIFKIKIDDNGDLWMACKGKILKLNTANQALEIFSFDKEEQLPVFGSLLFLKNGSIMAGSFGNGIWIKETNQNKFYPLTKVYPELPSIYNKLYILSLFRDSNDGIWIGSYGSGLISISEDFKNFQQFTYKKYQPKNIQYNDILSIYEDYSGVIWFGTDGAGVNFFDSYLDKFNYYTNDFTPELINIDVVRSVTKDKFNNIWIGTSGKGLTKHQPEKQNWKTFYEGNGDNDLICDRIMSLYSDEDGDVWVGSQDGGLHIIDKNDKITPYLKTDLYPKDALTIWRIIADAKSQIWLATGQRGLLKFDKRQGLIKEYSKIKGNFPSNNIRVVIDDGQHHLWVATDERGLYRLNPDKDIIENFSYYLETDSIQKANNYAIKTLHFDQNEQVLWIGSAGNGLMGIDLKVGKLYKYTTDDGLANNVIYAVIPDDNNNLWLSSNKGISRFAPARDWKEKPEITNFTTYDGLSKEFNTGAYFKADNGEIYFGALDGIYWVDPSKIQINLKPPKTVISHVEVDQVDIKQQNKPLKHFENTVLFKFASLQYSLTSRNRFAYKLDGFDDDWNQNENINFTRYTNLAPGDYTFKVISSNYDEVWNLEPAVFSFSILKPWWLTNFALVLYALSILLIGYLIYQYYQSKWKMKLELQIEHDKAERLKKLHEYKTKLYTNLSHEFRTPLSLIIAPVNQLLSENQFSTSIKNKLNLVHKNAQHLLNMSNQLLDLSKVESGFTTLKVSRNQLDVFIESHLENFESLASDKNITINYTKENLGIAWFDLDILQKILSNLMSNAVKYSPANSTIDITCKKDSNQQLNLTIRNIFTGTKPRNIQQLFERFYQAHWDPKGFGIGLSLVKELIQLHHGRITGNFIEPNYIQFEIEIPIDKSVYIEDSNIESLSTSDEIIFDDENTNDHDLPLLLIVDDHDDMRQYIKSLFESDFKIIEATNGKEGITLALEQVPNIIVSDIMMPETDGTTLCKTIKNDQRTSHIPIILLTAKSGNDNELKGLKTGADDYISKPFSPENLRQRVLNQYENQKRFIQKYEQNSGFYTERDAPSTENKFFTKLNTLINKYNLQSDFDVNDLCKELGMSRMQLHRKLKTLTNKNTSNYIKDWRLSKAHELISIGNMNTSEIAYNTGFSSPSYFIKCFKEKYGETPQELLAKKAI